jgi:signal transduction histidine kinase
LLQRVTLRQWTLIDAGISVLFFLGGLASLFVNHHGKGHPPHVALLVVALCLATFPIAFRRRYPVPVLVVVIGALAVANVLGQGFGGAPFVALPLYIVATTFERRDSAIALVAVGTVFLASLGMEALLRPAGGGVTYNEVTSSMVVAGAAWFVGDSVRARRAYIAGLALQAEQRQRREVERAQQFLAEERLQIARELHDIVAHSLSVIAVQSGVGRHVLDTQPEEARMALDAIGTISRSALGDLRRVLGVLRSEDPDGPSLTPAPRIEDLNQLLEQCRIAGLAVTYQLHGQVVPVSPSMDLSVYRIVQEALTNVTKHAGTAKATVDITFEEGAVVVSIVDEGTSKGSNPFPARDGDGEAQAHHGIIGMRERTAIFGGTLTAATRQRGGFEVRARLPFDPTPQ